MSTSQLLTERAAARFLSVSLSTIRRWRRAGTIPTFRVGDILRYDLKVLEQFIEKNTQNAGEQNGK